MTFYAEAVGQTIRNCDSEKQLLSKRGPTGATLYVCELSVNC